MGVRLVRVLRIVRVMRFVRLMRFFNALRLMLVAISACMVPLVWASLLLMAVTFIFGVVLQEQVYNYVDSFDAAPAAEGGHRIDDVRAIQALRRLCPDLLNTMHSLFMCISGGISWVEVFEALRHASAFASFVFAVYIWFMVLGVLNLVTGLFVEGAMKAAQKDDDSVMQAEMEWKQSVFNKITEVFTSCDADGSGTISFSEFKAQTRNPYVIEMFNMLDLDVLEAEGLFNLMDLRGTGEVVIDEFIIGCLRLKGNNKNISFATIMYENKQTIMVLSDLIGRMDHRLSQLVRRFASATVHETPNDARAPTCARLQVNV